MGPGKFLQHASADEQSTTTLEFVIAFPLIGIMIASLLQIALLMHARTIVDYAAFCAARSAAVWSPTEPVFNEAPARDSESEAAIRIHHSAAMACVSISPPIGSVDGGLAEVVNPPLEFVAAIGFARPVPQFAERLAYADRAIEVHLAIRAVNAGPFPVEMIEATVRFKQALFIPVASKLFGGDAPPVGIASGDFADIVSTYIMELDDEINSPSVCQ